MQLLRMSLRVKISLAFVMMSSLLTSGLSFAAIHLHQQLQDVRQTMLIVAGSVLVLSLLAAMLLSQYLTRPLRRLLRGVQRLAHGDLRQRIALSSNDEFGELARIFNQMADAFSNTVEVAGDIAKGDLSRTVRLQSEQALLNSAFEMMTRYLKEIAMIATRISNGDLSVNVEPNSNKDVLGKAFHTMVTNLAALVAKIRASAEDVASNSKAILSRAQRDLAVGQRVSSVAEETSSVAIQMKQLAEDIAGRMEELFASFHQTLSSTEQMGASMKHIATTTSNLAEITDQTALSVEEITRSMEKVDRDTRQAEQLTHDTMDIAIEGREVVDTMIANTLHIQDVMTATSQTVQGLADRSEAIGAVVDVINDVADQTALLALNASIIAAQAGDYGRGFSVVAEGIKDLATRVAASTKEITAIVKETQQESNEAVRTMLHGRQEMQKSSEFAKGVGQALEKIVTSAQHSSDIVANIATLTGQQQERNQQVRELMDTVAAAVSEVSRTTKEHASASMQIIKAVDGMHHLAEQVTEATSEQTQIAKNVLNNMERVTTSLNGSIVSAKKSTQSATQLSAQAEKLLHSVDYFV